MTFSDKVKDLITLYDVWLSDPQDFVQLEQWIYNAHTLAYSYEFTEKEELYIDKIIDIYEDLYRKKLARKNTSLRPSKEKLDALLSSKQIEQRTPEWYKQMATIISASELGHLFASQRQRAKLVLSKTVCHEPFVQPLAVTSDRMSAFDWGIRFEPVVKQIYEYKYGTTIKELGRLHHPDDPRCTASPDGLVYSCPKNERTGRLIEIKCPVTREIDGSVPKDYYSQMQMQLHVTQLNECDYVEAGFVSSYNILQQKEGPGLYHGYIAVIRYNEIHGNQDFYYIYSPVNATSDWIPLVEEEIVEIIPWRLYQWNEQVITRNDEWWKSLQPIIHKFWEDVELAKQGSFVIPDSTRANKKQKIEKCVIQFTKVDENGMEI
jgi:hypothetical protein